MEFLYFWLYPAAEPTATQQAQPQPTELATPTAPSTPRKTSKPPSSEHAHTLSGRPSTVCRSRERDATDFRLRAMLESTHDGWSPMTPSKPSRTFEKTQLALSRSAAAAASVGMSPRRSRHRVSFGRLDETRPDLTDEERGIGGTDENRRPATEAFGSPARVMSTSHSSTSLKSSMPARGRVRSPVQQQRLSSISTSTRSPEARRKAILGSASALSASRSSIVPGSSSSRLRSSSPLTPTTSGSPRFARSAGFTSSSLRPRPLSVQSTRSSQEDDPDHVDSYLFKSPRPPTAASASSSSPAVSLSSPTVPRTRVASLGVPASPATPRRHRPYTAQTELPGYAGETRGLFAPPSPAPPAAALPTADPSPQSAHHATTTGAGGTRDRRRQVLGRYLGNVDQLLDRFEVLRCGA